MAHGENSQGIYKKKKKNPRMTLENLLNASSISK
jgi:hypothetical protein